MKKKCGYPSCSNGAYYGTYYIKAGKRAWGTFCDRHEKKAIRERKIADLMKGA